MRYYIFRYSTCTVLYMWISNLYSNVQLVYIYVYITVQVGYLTVLYSTSWIYICTLLYIWISNLYSTVYLDIRVVQYCVLVENCAAGEKSLSLFPYFLGSDKGGGGVWTFCDIRKVIRTRVGGGVLDFALSHGHNKWTVPKGPSINYVTLHKEGGAPLRLHKFLCACERLHNLEGRGTWRFADYILFRWFTSDYIIEKEVKSG